MNRLVGEALIWTCAALAVSCNSRPEPEARPHEAPVDANAAPVVQPAGKVRITAAPAQGEVEPLVRDAMGKAEAGRQRLLVYVGAVWCEPCKRFHQAAESGELDALLPGLTLLEFDLDRDSERLASAGYVSKYIPLFARPAPSGSASGRQVEGGVKGQAAVPFIVSRVQALLEE